MKRWKTIDQSVVFDASPFLKVVKQKVELPNGVEIDDFYQVHLRHFVMVIPVLPNDKVLTIRQYKHGPGRVSLTFPAGFVEEGELPEEAAKRELLEETGYSAGTLTHLGEFVDNGNQLGCVGNYYVATDCLQTAEPDSGDLEEMILEERNSSEIDRALKDGDIAIIHHAAAWGMARSRGLIPDA